MKTELNYIETIKTKAWRNLWWFSFHKTQSRKDYQGKVPRTENVLTNPLSNEKSLKSTRQRNDMIKVCVVDQWLWKQGEPMLLRAWNKAVALRTERKIQTGHNHWRESHPPSQDLLSTNHAPGSQVLTQKKDSSAPKNASYESCNSLNYRTDSIWELLSALYLLKSSVTALLWISK